MVCLRLIGHQLHGNRRAGRRDRVKDDGLHIFPGRISPVSPRTSPSSSRIRSLSQTLFPSGLVSHTSAWLPSSTTAPHTPTWNAWASNSCQPSSSGTSGVPLTADASKGGGVNSPCAGLCVYTRAAAIIARHSRQTITKTGTAQFFLCFCCAKTTPHSFPSCPDTG